MHHANIIIGRVDCKNFVFDILKKDLNFDVQANPDFLNVEKESFGIDDARDLIKWAIGKPLGGEAKAFLVVTQSITLEAQNALLKVLEEPPVGTYIFFHLENLGGVLNTFLSRIKVLDLPNLSKGVKGHPLGQNSSRVTFGEKTPFDNKDGEAQKFLRSDIKNKLAIINTFSKKEDKNKMKVLIKDLEIVGCQNKISANRILSAKIFASARGSSPKMILEWLAYML